MTKGHFSAVCVRLLESGKSDKCLTPPETPCQGVRFRGGGEDGDGEGGGGARSGAGGDDGCTGRRISVNGGVGASGVEDRVWDCEGWHRRGAPEYRGGRGSDGGLTVGSARRGNRGIASTLGRAEEGRARGRRRT
jgi:hypothetical protein